MSYPVEQNEKFAAYANPERLVSTEWLAAALADGAVADGKLVVVESDEDVLLYETGHIPGAVKIDWHTDLNDEVTRDYVDGAAFAALASAKGISRDSTVVIYGDKSNWWAAYALWVFTLFGHEDVRLLDGGRDKWIAEGRELTTDVPAPARGDYPEVERNDAPIRAFKEDVLAHLGKPLIDVRSPEEYTGQRTHMPAYPEEGALRGGHIPTAASVPWAKAAAEDGTYRSREELEASTLAKQASRPVTTSWRTAASASVPATLGSPSSTCWALSPSATTTAHGPNGAMQYAFPSSREPSADPFRPPWSVTSTSSCYVVRKLGCDEYQHFAHRTGGNRRRLPGAVRA